MKTFRNARILPLVLVAIIALVGLKIMGLILEGGYIFGNDVSPPRKASWAQNVFNFPGGSSSTPDPADITGSVEANKSPVKPEDAAKVTGVKPAESKPVDSKPSDMALSDPTTINGDPSRPVSASERAILERLQDRRQELDARARELDIRENLLRAAEKRIESKVEEVKAVEARIGAVNDQKSQADATRFKGIVTMYETMKPKDAAKIFDRLDMSVLIEVASQIAPRKMSDIVGQMQPEAAERLTVEMARRAGGDKTASASDLPKIEGRPNADGGN